LLGFTGSLIIVRFGSVIHKYDEHGMSDKGNSGIITNKRVARTMNSGRSSYDG
jgi:hypothetical protein